jgi:hypothetical protein
MWSTRETLSVNEDKEIVVRTTIRELVVYCMFIFVLSLGVQINSVQYLVTFSLQSPLG